MVIDVPTDVESYKRFLEENQRRKAAEQAATGNGGSNGTTAPEPHPGSPEYQAADAQARAIVTEQGGNPSGVQRAETPPPPKSRGASMAMPMGPEVLPGSAVLGKLAEAVSQAARRAASWAVGAAPAAAGVAAQAVAGAVPLIVIPTNSQAELHPIDENLRVRTAPGQRSATVQLRVEHGLFGTGIGAKWIDLPVGAAWASDDLTRRRYIAIDRRGLEQAIGRDAADAALGGNGIAKAEKEDDEWGREARSKKTHPRERQPKGPRPAEDHEQRPDQPPRKRPHELSDAQIDEIADKIVSGHASAKHWKEFPDLPSDTEKKAHVAEVIRKKDYKDLPEGRTAYWDKSGTTVFVDPLGEGSVYRPTRGREYFDEL